MKRIFPSLLFLALSLYSSTILAQFSIELRHEQSPEIFIGDLDNLIINSGESAQIGGVAIVSGGSKPYVFSWEPSDGLDDPEIPNPTASPEGTTTYMLTVADANNCSTVAQQTVTVKGLSGFSESAGNEGIRIFPNPGKGVFHIEIRDKGWGGSISLQLISLTGQLILDETVVLTGGVYSGQISLRSHPPGSYILRIETQQGSYQQLVVNQ